MAEKPARAGVYVHFPWCLAKCPYCDFVSYASPASSVDHAAYADAVLREMEARAPLVAGRSVETIFFGGGTPSLWETSELGRVLARVRERFGAAATTEVTVECNPTSLDEDKARSLADVGVNRLSIGVQALRDDHLRYLGRLHDAGGAVEAVRGALRAKVPRVSADLIFGLPGQSPADARDQALALAELGLDHLSCYQLTIEAKTKFGELARRGRLALADDGIVAEAFLAIDEALTSGGFRHYEVSNYARPGQEARHNLGYWRGDEYLGLGCAAVGFVRKDDSEGRAHGVRYRNPVLPESFARATRAAREAEQGPSTEADAISESTEGLDDETLLRERIMLGLRMDEGVDLEREASTLRTTGWTSARVRAARRLEERGRIVREGPRVRIPRAAWLWTDDTAASLF